jgi:deoxyribonuclease-4
MPYLPNLASPDPAQHKRSKLELVRELKRSTALGCEMVVVHMGSHRGKGREKGLHQVIRAIRYALRHGPSGSQVKIVLENTSGYQNSVGDSFEDLAYVLDAFEDKDRLGICFDTCHGFAAGYDLRTPRAVTRTLKNLNQVVGLESLSVIHVNDSKGELGDHHDRHEHIGLGKIGESGFRAIVTHRKLRKLPMILETPGDSRGDMGTNLAKLRLLSQPIR